MVITEIRLCTELNSGIYQSDRDAYAEPEKFEPTEANLALAMDKADYRCIFLAGSYGSIGAGDTWVEVDTDDGETWTVESIGDYPTINLTNPDLHRLDYRDAINALIEEGEVDRDILEELTGQVWDGHNHVDFVPHRAESYCENHRIEYYRWGEVEYSFEGSGDDSWWAISNMRIKEDWMEIGFVGTITVLCEGMTDEMFEALWENMPDNVEEFVDGDERALYCKIEDWPVILASLAEAEDED